MSQDTLTPDSVPKADGMPVLGLGTWQNEDHDQCADSVATALEMGYRHIDTAQAYGNEAAVGDGIAQADVDREDVFLATKVWISNLEHDDVLSSTEASLEKLGVDYVDLLYVHWPSGEYDPEGTLSAFDQLVDEGKVKNVGVSNFEPEHVDEAIDTLDADVFANQFECHPLLPQEELRAHCDDAGVNVVAYSPLARGKVFDVPEIQRIAEKHDASAAAVSLAWLRRKGVTAIPKATSEEHIRDNWASLSVDLDADDVAAIDAIDEREREVDPDFAPW
ncbi:aldo/keto reductase [Haloarchaeobius litoreus]|uniref:Aldo/keto reductase n=1 Tax=Haloarchaeobius litoreus TaxID=755306 RepID=A0ABD6DF10_9EURY